MSEESNSEKKIVSADIEVLLKVGLDVKPNEELEVVVYSTDEDEAS